MPLTLVTGPANSAKAGEVLGGMRDRLDDEPVLVVPAFGDVEHNQRELAERGALFGARVLVFERLFHLIAQRLGRPATMASKLQRELLVEEAVLRADLRVLRHSAGRPGFVRAAVELVSELGRAEVDPDRFGAALDAWAGGGPRRAYARDVAAIYTAYRDALERAGLEDPELFARRGLDGLRLDPSSWGSTPVFVYGFDDFTEVELDALETLSGRCAADVTVSLPFEPGRTAFRATARIHARLSELATERRQLPPRSDHYADASRSALHHLERNLFELGEADRADPGAAVRTHVAGGERAEVELAAREILELLRAGVAPGDVALVLRDPGRYASLLGQVFDAYGIPFSLDRPLPLGHTGLGRSLLALLRCADGRGTADDLLTWLRSPGRLEQPALADRLEAEVRREGAEDAARARALWERDHWTLEELDRLGRARDAAGFLEELSRQLERLFSAPYRRRAPVLDGAELTDARAFEAARKAIGEMARIAGTLDRHRVHETLYSLHVWGGAPAGPDRVQVAAPETVRARRFQAVFVCGLQEGEFPRGAAPEPFLPDEDRRAIAAASGLRLPLREDQLDRERYLFYVSASRAERLLVLSTRYCDEEGDPEAPSFFVEDVLDLFSDVQVRRRTLSEVTWSAEEAPTAAEYERAVALQGPRRELPRPGPLTWEPLLTRLAARGPLSAGAFERYADCPMKWLVEQVLRPDELRPEPEPLVRGAYAHAVLARTYDRLREETGRRRVTDETLPAAERILLDELRAQQAAFRLSPKQTRVRAAVRKLEFDLLAHLRWEAGLDGDFEPEWHELEFGPIEVAHGVEVRGRIDRVDVLDGMALVRDYKSSRKLDRYKVASWEDANRFQAAVYMLAVREERGLEPVGGVYAPITGEDRRPRGMVARDVEGVGSAFFDNDRLDRESFEAVLERARERLVETARRMRGGELACTPETCRFDGTCSYPALCRVEG